jgi:hypothetical protein
MTRIAKNAILAIGLALLAACATAAMAQDPNYNTARTSAPLPPTVSFTTAPVWERVPGTQVSIIRSDQRPTFDMFSFGNEYYVYNDGSWYRASQLNGPYVGLEAKMLPPEFHAVPRASWISYPTTWSTSTENIAMGQAGTAGTIPTATVATPVASNFLPTVTFKTAPHWTLIPGTPRIYQIRAKERPTDYDLFRYGPNYYVYQNGNWYRATQTEGPYAAIALNEVPPKFRTIRQRYWVNYPADWRVVKSSTAKRTASR